MEETLEILGANNPASPLRWLIYIYLYLYKFEKEFLATSIHKPSHSQLYFSSILHLIYFVKKIMGTLHPHVSLKQEVNSN